jgi:hypothetical protein
MIHSGRSQKLNLLIRGLRARRHSKGIALRSSTGAPTGTRRRIRNDREGTLTYRRAAVYHAGLLFVAGGGLLRALGGNGRDYSAVIGTGTVLLLAIALSNSWQLLLSHDPETGARGT